MKLRILLASSAALALAACGDAAEENVADETIADSGALAPEQGAVDGAMPTNAQEFATMQAASDLYEIEAGRLAQDNATDQAVSDFGAMMVEDHTQSTANLRDSASEAQGVTINPQMTPEQQSNIEALRNAGENFDRTYIEQQVAAHEKALSMLQNYAQNGDDAALRDFASQTAGVVENHLEQARQLQEQTQQQNQQQT